MSAGGRVTCVSAARMLGLWIPHPPDRLHLAVHPHAGRDMSRFVAHRNLGPVRALPRSPLDAIENVLARVATCQPHLEALAIWESAINKRLVTVAHLQAVDWTTQAARALASEAGGASDSGLETLVVHRLARLGIHALQQVPCWVTTSTFSSGSDSSFSSTDSRTTRRRSAAPTSPTTGACASRDTPCCASTTSRS